MGRNFSRGRQAQGELLRLGGDAEEGGLTEGAESHGWGRTREIHSWPFWRHATSEVRRPEPAGKGLQGHVSPRRGKGPCHHPACPSRLTVLGGRWPALESSQKCQHPGVEDSSSSSHGGRHFVSPAEQRLRLGGGSDSSLCCCRSPTRVKSRSCAVLDVPGEGTGQPALPLT